MNKIRIVTVEEEIIIAKTIVLALETLGIWLILTPDPIEPTKTT